MKLIDEFLKKRTLDERPVRKQLNGIDDFKRVIDNTSGTICVVPDFDCDGVMSGVIGVLGLRALGYSVCLHPTQPERGHGMTIDDVNEIVDEFPDVTCIITADQGSNCLLACTHAKHLGLDVIITDHHEYSGRVVADAYVNPCAVGSDYPLDICGAVVLWTCLGKPADLACFAAIATVADMMTLQRDNRILVANMNLRACDNAGVKQLVCFADYMGQEADAEFVAFYVAPLINSIRRCGGDINQAFDLFLSDGDVSGIFDKLVEQNNKRKELVNEYNANLDTKYAPYVYLSDAPASMLGLIAQKRLRGAPVLVVDSVSLNGSGRAPSGVDARSLLSGHGASCAGHAQAFGVSIEDLDEVVDYMKTTDWEALGAQSRDSVDFEVDGDKLDFSDLVEFCNELEKLAPFGFGFERPKFRIHISDDVSTRVLKDKHVKYELSPLVQFLQWNDLARHDVVCGTPRLNWWRGTATVQFS